ncbi:MAG: hypothetical protein ACRBB6_14115 [Neptuniibacter sp.]
MKPSDDDIFLDWHKPRSASFIDELAKRVTDDIESEMTRVKNHDARLYTAKKFISALFAAYSAVSTKKHQPFVSLSLTTSHYTGHELSYSQVASVKDALLAEHLIKVQKGTEYRGRTRIKAVGQLAETFDSHICIWIKQDPVPHEDLLQLKDTKENKQALLLVDETDDVRVKRDNLFRINDYLIQQCTCLDLPDNELISVAASMSKKRLEAKLSNGNKTGWINLHSIQMRRIFNNGSMYQGGRFYGGWWQGIPSIYRPHIVINGEKTVEIDYSSVAIRILYDEAGIELNPDQDLYDLGLSDWQGKLDPRRTIIKKFLVAKINDHKNLFRLDEDQQEVLGMNTDQLMSLIREKHAPIIDFLEAGNGLSAQYRDSQIAEQVMLGMINQDVPILPIHDSFIVPLSHKEQLIHAMDMSFRTICADKADVTVDMPRNIEHFGMSKSEYSDLNLSPESLTDTEIVNNPDHSNSRMYKYYQSWLKQQ